MARIFLTTGETGVSVGSGSNQVFGTNGNESVDVAANGDAEFDASFNRGGDTINIAGNAANYVASISGSFLVLTSTASNSAGADIRIPIGSGTGATIKFADTATGRVLSANGSTVTLGSQTVALTGSTNVAAGDPTAPGGTEEILLTPNQDIKSGTGGNDIFLADVVQVNGLQVNTLGTGDNVQGGAGSDQLLAQIYRAATFDGNGGLGGINGGSNAPVQPRLNAVEITKLEALNSDLATHQPYGRSAYLLGDYYFYGSGYGTLDLFSQFSNNTEVYFNARNVRGHDEIWSWYSDANLTVQDLTTIVAGGGHDDARNTSEITIGMGYTSGQDTFWDSSDYHVFFDQDFLLTGQANNSRAIYFLLDEDADLDGRPPLDFIDVDGIRFTVNGGPVITLSAPAAQDGNTHAGFVAALQGALQDLIDDGLVPEDTTLYVDPTITDFTFLDDGSQSSPIPAIVLETSTDAVFTPVGFSRVEDAIGEYDVYGQFTTEVDEQELPLSVNIVLEKVGRGGEGGDLIVGSMDKYNNGIDVFDITVNGDDSRPSWLDYLNSTGDSEYGLGQEGELDVINLVSDNSGFPDPSTYAALTIGATNDNLTLIDAQEFLGDLTLGILEEVLDLKTLLATGGGDVSFYGSIYSNATGVFTYQTGAGDDTIDLYISGEALEYATSALVIDTGAGDDYVEVGMYWGQNSNQDGSDADFPNHIILDNVDINTGTGADVVELYGNGQFRVDTGDNNDVIYSGGTGNFANWVFNVDRGAYDTNDELNGLPGVPLRYSLIDGATVRITFSGAGSNVGGDGGGVMEENGLPLAPGDADADGAPQDPAATGVAFHNGIEASFTIDLANGKFFGTQADINNAIIKAIENSPVLSKLIVASVGANNTLVVSSIIPGEFVTQDIDIAITRAAAYATTSTTVWSTSLLQEAIGLNLIESNTIAAGESPSTSGADYNLVVGAALDNGFYAGIDNDRTAPSFQNLHFSSPTATPFVSEAGSTSSYESDHTFTPGLGNDVVVLNTDNDQGSSNGYWTLDGWLFDDASNETIVLRGENFGTDTIINFETAGVEDYIPEASNEALPPPNPDGGFDFLDFTAYLVSKETDSGSVGSLDFIAVSLDDESGGTVPDTLAPASANLLPNSVVVVDLIETATEKWAGLTAQELEDVINGSTTIDTSFANLNEGDFTLDDSRPATGANSISGPLGAGDARSIVMVQNGTNLGQYKVFEVRWLDNSGTSVPVADVFERGVLDFGTSLVGLDELNLVGSTEYNTFNVDISGTIL